MIVMRRRFSYLLAFFALVGFFIAGCGSVTAGIVGTGDGSPPQRRVSPKQAALQRLQPLPTRLLLPRRIHLAPCPRRRAVLLSAAASFASRALARTNAYRSQFNCPPLRENAQLDQAAFSHSQDMALHGYFDHNSPSGQTPWDRMHAAGYQFSMAAENIAAGYPTPEAVIDAFFHETPPNDGHRRNLLNCALRDVGFGYYYRQGSVYGSYWTQDFATPL